MPLHTGGCGRVCVIPWEKINVLLNKLSKRVNECASKRMNEERPFHFSVTKQLCDAYQHITVNVHFYLQNILHTWLAGEGGWVGLPYLTIQGRRITVQCWGMTWTNEYPSWQWAFTHVHPLAVPLLIANRVCNRRSDVFCIACSW